jgi:hypothetical protein
VSEHSHHCVALWPLKTDRRDVPVGGKFVIQFLQSRRMTYRARQFISRHEHNHSEETAAPSNGAREECEPDRQGQIQAIISSEIIPRVKPELFRERKGLGICNRNAAFRYHRRNFCVAGLRDRGCTQAISAVRRKLSASKKIRAIRTKVVNLVALKTLTEQIRAQLEERGFCVVFESDLQRCWPLEEIAWPERKRAIQEFAESQGWTAAILDGAFGTRAIFQRLGEG